MPLDLFCSLIYIVGVKTPMIDVGAWSAAKYVLVAAVIFIVLILVIPQNISNEQVKGGYAQYIYTKPYFGKSTFQGVQIGPDSTGIRWRIRTQIVSITPYTYEEKFDNILSKDNLPMSVECSIIWKIESDKVREFVEKFGGLDENTDPDRIARYAYEDFIQKQLMNILRSEYAKYESLKVSANISEISDVVTKRLRERLTATPFEVTSVVIGKTMPPDEVTNQIKRTAVAQQQIITQEQERVLAERQVEIQRQKGMAEARMMEEKALGQLAQTKAKADAEYYTKQKAADAIRLTYEAEADGQKKLAAAMESKNKAIGQNLILYQFVENFKEAKLPQTLTVVGSDFLEQILRRLQPEPQSR